MMLHGGGSAKRTATYSNIPEIQGFDLGTLHKEEKEKRTTIKTVRTLNASMISDHAFFFIISIQHSGPCPMPSSTEFALCSLASQPAKASIRIRQARRDFKVPLHFHPRSCSAVREGLTARGFSGDSLSNFLVELKG